MDGPVEIQGTKLDLSLYATGVEASNACLWVNGPVSGPGMLLNATRGHIRLTGTNTHVLGSIRQTGYGDIVLQDILSRYNRGAKWTPIGHTYMFEGDYDGGGKMIRSGQIKNVGSYIGIFGQVSGSIHNLGVEKITIETNDQSSRCGAIAGLLLGSRAEQPGQQAIPTSGEMTHCYAANNTVKAPYAGGLVGEMIDIARMSHCHGANNDLTGSYSGGIASLIRSQAKVDNCFTTERIRSCCFEDAMLYF